MAIGVFDSGLGGLSVLGTLRRRLPGEHFVYFGDNAHAPYGVRPDAEILELTRAGIERLFAAGCELVVLACNTASAVALRPLQEHWLPGAAPGRRVLGVFVPMIEAVTGRPWGYRGAPLPARLASVGFFGTPATVRSGAFTRELGLRATGLDVTEIGCPGLVEAIEDGDR
ncbi:MAG: glutamate racemase, partial [Thermohalobaculum sp.]|nr:glutamate racemase [Thermohalobaculum sp.]